MPDPLADESISAAVPDAAERSEVNAQDLGKEVLGEGFKLPAARAV